MTRDIQTRHLKRAIRRSIVAEVLGLDPDDRTAQESLLLERFPALPGYAIASTVLLYIKAFPEEVDTPSLLRHALQSGKRVVCPRVERAEHRLRLFQITSLSADLEPGILGIPEPRTTCAEVAPEEVDWALIPGLAFDSRGYRLGRGGGHYDRLLPLLRTQVPRWALGFGCQVVTELPIEAHDIPLTGIATADRLICAH
jgi:5-formyltetrahydrofolate cyclo-ligase